MLLSNIYRLYFIDDMHISFQVHPKAAQFQKKGCDHYKLLEIKFNKNNATGVLHHSFAQDPPNMDEDNELIGTGIGVQTLLRV